jgi:hypothetical protein
VINIQLQVATLLSTGMHTPVAKFKTTEGRSTWLWEMPFLTAAAVLLFSPESLQSDNGYNWK